MTEGVMNKVRLGRGGLMVTPICFGTSGLGDMPDTYGYGVNDFIDTSGIYRLGRSERGGDLATPRSFSRRPALFRRLRRCRR